MNKLTYKIKILIYLLKYFTFFINLEKFSITIVLTVVDNPNGYFFSLETGYSTCDVINCHVFFEILTALSFL